MKIKNIIEQIKLWWKFEGRYYHRDFINGVKNLWSWFPVIWKDRDWDHHYIFEILKFKLEKQAKHLAEVGFHNDAQRDAELMMTCVRLIDKLQNEYYYDELCKSGVRASEAVKNVIAKHKKAKRLLFKIMNDRIEEWWD